MNISKETISLISEKYTVTFYDDYTNEVEPEKATIIHIGFELNEKGEFVNVFCKSIKAPTKKEVTFDWVMEKVNQTSIFKNFTDQFKKLIPSGLSVYPTTYGIGVFVMLGFRGELNKTIEQVENLLKEKGIEFQTEYSSARWVFRFRISQSRENMARVSKI